MKVSFRNLPLVLSTVLLVSACATQPGPNTVTRDQAMRTQTVEFGTVESVRSITITPSNTYVGTGTGAVLGGIAGSTIGGGSRANAAGAVAGAVAGGAIGSAVQGSGTTQGVEITVKLDNGNAIAVAQPGMANDFRAGDRVRVTSDGQTTRVSR